MSFIKQQNYTGYSYPTAISISLALSSIYVVILYFNNLSKPNEKRDRNDPKVIRSRIILVTIFTVFVLITLPTIISKLSNTSIDIIYSQFGLVPGWKYKYDALKFENGRAFLIIRDIFQSVLLVSILFIGPLIDKIFFEQGAPFAILNDLKNDLQSLSGIRDLIVGPFTEEFIYTGAIIVTLLQVPGISRKTLIFLPPAFFSIAHIHHALELYKQKVALKIIAAITLIQLSYTFLFGIFTNFLYLRTGNLLACFLVHSYCNFLGVPKLTLDTSTSRYWKIVYYLLLASGVYGFQKFLFTFTESSLALVSW